MEPFAHPSFLGVIGVARRDITPPVGIYARNWGAAAHDQAEGIHRPLMATVLTLQAGGSESLVLAALDLGWWRAAEDEWWLRSRVLDALGGANAVPRLMISLSHTHSGPSICREDAGKPGGELIGAYLDYLEGQLVSAVDEARESARPSVLEWSTGKCALAKHRDLLDPDQPRLICGFDPAGPADDTLLVGRVTGMDGTPLATLVNYACHPVTLAWQNRQISPDFVGAMRELVEAANGAPCLFLQGASGELAPREQYSGDTDLADRNGRCLGHAVLSVLEGMLPPRVQLEYAGAIESGAVLATWEPAPSEPSSALAAAREEIRLPLKPLPPVAELERQLEACADRVVAERLQRQIRTRRTMDTDSTTRAPVWTWRVGNALFLGHPNEAYSALQRRLRAAFPEDAVVVMNVVNGWSGYLPPSELYSEDIYQVWQTPFAKGCLEEFMERAEAILRRLPAPGTKG